MVQATPLRAGLACTSHVHVHAHSHGVQRLDLLFIPLVHRHAMSQTFAIVSASLLLSLEADVLRATSRRAVSLKPIKSSSHDAAIIHGKVGGYSHAACRNGERVARHDQGGIVDASPCRSEFRERPHREVHLRRPLLADCE